jgi:RNA polymerase sigma factor (sigma-70 family)
MADSGDAFERRFADLYRIAFRQALAVVRIPAVAEDCAQEALVRAFARWSTVADHATPWVSRVASNLAIDHLRRSRRWMTIDGDDVAGPARGAADLDAVEGRQVIVGAFHTLRGRQRHAVALRYLADLSEADTAARMRCSVGSVKSSSSRGLQRLRAAVGGGSSYAAAH